MRICQPRRTRLSRSRQRSGARKKRSARRQKQPGRQKKKQKESRGGGKKVSATDKAASYNVASLGNISFKWPCPSSSRISSGFGGRTSPTKGASSNHQGIDIPASTGAAITAAASGTLWCLPTAIRGKLHYDQSWRWCIHRIYALFPDAGIGRPDGKTGTDDCKSRLYRLFYRLTSAFRYPLRRTLCKSAVLRKPVKIQKQTR